MNELMLGRINHIAIVVPDLDVAAAQWQARTGANVSSPQSLPDHSLSADTCPAFLQFRRRSERIRPADSQRRYR